MAHRFPLPGEVESLIKTLGKNIRIARIRREMPLSELAAKVGISRRTMMEIEQGKPGSGLAHYVTALWVLGLHEPLSKIADPDEDEHGKVLESTRQRQRIRKPAITAESYDF